MDRNFDSKILPWSWPGKPQRLPPQMPFSTVHCLSFQSFKLTLPVSAFFHSQASFSCSHFSSGAPEFIIPTLPKRSPLPLPPKFQCRVKGLLGFDHSWPFQYTWYGHTSVKLSSLKFYKVTFFKNSFYFSDLELFKKIIWLKINKKI